MQHNPYLNNHVDKHAWLQARELHSKAFPREAERGAEIVVSKLLKTLTNIIVTHAEAMGLWSVEILQMKGCVGINGHYVPHLAAQALKPIAKHFDLWERDDERRSTSEHGLSSRTLIRCMRRIWPTMRILGKF